MYIVHCNTLNCFGIALAWCLYYLAMHEEVQEKLYHEFVDALGEENITAQITSQLK